MKKTCKICNGVDGVDSCDVGHEVCADCLSDHDLRQYDRHMER